MSNAELVARLKTAEIRIWALAGMATLNWVVSLALVAALLKAGV